MAKKVCKMYQGKVMPAKVQWDWIGIDEEDYVIVEDEEGKYGKFLAIYKPTKPEDIELVEKNTGE